MGTIGDLQTHLGIVKLNNYRTLTIDKLIGCKLLCCGLMFDGNTIVAVCNVTVSSG